MRRPAGPYMYGPGPGRMRPGLPYQGNDWTRRLCPAVGDDQVRRHTQQKPGGQHPQPERTVAVAAHAVPDLTDHVQHGAARERVEQQLERARVDLVADERAEERRPA